MTRQQFEAVVERRIQAGTVFVLVIMGLAAIAGFAMTLANS